jgi:DUF3102 family protein
MTTGAEMGRDLAVRGNRDTQSADESNAHPPFDYGALSSSVSKFLKGQADRIRRTMGASIIHLGKDLIAAKRYLSHGAFLRWVESEVGIPARTAQAYMQVALWAKDKNASAVNLPPSMLYFLSARSTPEGFALDILKKVEAGENLSLNRLRSELKKLRRMDEHVERLSIRDKKTQRDHLTTEPQFVDDHAATALLCAVKIVARGLSRSDLAQVCDVMTSRLVLDDPALPRSIETAFMIAQKMSGEAGADGTATTQRIVDDERTSVHQHGTAALFSDPGEVLDVKPCEDLAC